MTAHQSMGCLPMDNRGHHPESPKQEKDKDLDVNEVRTTERKKTRDPSCRDDRKTCLSRKTHRSRKKRFSLASRGCSTVSLRRRISAPDAQPQL